MDGHHLHEADAGASEEHHSAVFIEYVDGSVLRLFDLAPDQAVEATLGRGTCKNVAEPDDYSDRPFTCSECGARGPMGNGTYHMASSFTLPDGTIVHGDSWPVWKFCPNCGRRIVRGEA